MIGRKSPNSLYDEDLATFESSNYDQRDAEGFIKLNALRLKISLNSSRVLGKNLKYLVPLKRITSIISSLCSGPIKIDT